MPFIKDDREQQFFDRSIGTDQIDIEDTTTFKERSFAAYRLENSVGSMVSQVDNLPDGSKATDYDVWSNLSEDEKLNESFVENAMYADNEDELIAVRKQSERENRDRETLANGGLLEVMMVSIADPVNFIPVGGTAYKTYKTGVSVLANAAATATAAASSTAILEGELHRTQLTRTYGESAANVTAAAMFGGVLGATPGVISKLFSKSDLADIEKTMKPDEAIDAGGNSTMSDRSIGAAQVMEDAQIRGKFARAVAKSVAFDPLTRTITSDNKSTRILTSKLAENPLDMDVPLGTSVESAIKIHDGRYFEAVEGHAAAYKEYKAGGGKMKYRDFNEAVGKAQRNGSDDPIIQKAADSWESKLYDPLRTEAINAKLLPDDVEVTTAKNYLNRIWNKEKISTNAKKFNDVVSRWLVDRQPDLDLDDASDLAREIMGRIIGTPDGRLQYDYKIGENSSKGSGKSGLKGQFKTRSFDIPDELVDDFLENDIEVLGGRYLKSVAPDIELVKRFGDINLEAEIKRIEQDWDEVIEDAKTPKEARALVKKRDADIRDIAAMRDRMRGVYGQVDHDNPWVRAGRVARDLNYMRLLGGVVASSIPDVARITAAEGIGNTFSKGLAPLVRNTKAFKMAAREAKLYGVGTDALMGGRAEIIADVADYSQGGTAFERGVRAAATKFSSINLMNQWTGGIKQLHAVVTQTRIGDDMMAGRYDKRLGQLGISEADSSAISKQVKKYGKKIDGVWVMNSRDWDNQDLAMMWGAALRKESDRVIIVPGQEKPLFMSSELGKTIFQFKTFMFSATQRVMLSTLQKQDKHYLQGVLGLASIGMLAYAFKTWDAGRELSDDPKVWVTEGIDRSGMLGVFMEINNTLEKISGNSYGLRPMIGINAPASRYASRSALDSALGPTFGLAGEVVKIAGAATNQRDWADSDTRALRRLLPGQNLSFLRQGLDEVEKTIAE